MKYTRPRGTHDITPLEIARWQRVEHTFQRAFERYGYRGIRTPIFESTDLFVRAVGAQSDIVTKEMYTFTDRGGRSLTLRPENTASVIRAYLENGMHRWGGIQRLCYEGPMFRYDRPQAGRYRQFHQVGAEAIGSASPALDVEIIQLVVEALRELGFTSVDVRVNSVGTEASRVRYRQVLLDAIESRRADLTEDALARYRQNPLRIFDAKEYSAAFKEQLPRISDYLVDDDRVHFDSVQNMLASVAVPFTHDVQLVRGLDYYTRTVFEVYGGERSAQSALCGGGRYDTLVAECGGPDTPAIGMSAGLERIVEALPATSRTPEEVGPHYYVVCAGADAEARALQAARILREFGSVELDVSGRSVKTQLEAAGKKKARVAVVVDAAGPEVAYHDLAARTDAKVGFAALREFALQSKK